MTAEDLEKQRKENELNAAQKKADSSNATRTGVGTRLFVGRTRGKGSMVISFENFDESKPETLPTSIEQFASVTGKNDEKDIVSYLITGYNNELYTAASDPLAEYVNLSWPAEAQAQFRLVVRNYARGANVSLDDAVELIKPGFDKQFSPASR